MVGEGEAGIEVRTREEKTTDSELVESRREVKSIAEAVGVSEGESRVEVRVMGVEKV